MIKHVIWDWNGTLLDDVDCAVLALNVLLAERELPPLQREHYLEHFGFPVRDFYVKLGFDFQREVFERVSERFIEHYNGHARGARLHAQVLPLLTALQELGVEQSVLSAMEARMLQRMLREHRVLPYMRHVRGLDHLHATSKVALGLDLLQAIGADPDEVLLIGDTLHDYETANAMGCRCLLFGRGHQAYARLAECGATVIDSLHAVREHVEAARVRFDAS